MTSHRATRNLKDTTDDALADMHGALARLLEHQRHISPGALTELCLMDEEVTAETGKRATAARRGLRAVRDGEPA